MSDRSRQAKKKSSYLSRLRETRALQYPHGESNPGFRTENPTSWATRRWGRDACELLTARPRVSSHGCCGKGLFLREKPSPLVDRRAVARALIGASRRPHDRCGRRFRTPGGFAVRSRCISPPASAARRFLRGRPRGGSGCLQREESRNRRLRLGGVRPRMNPKPSATKATAATLIHDRRVASAS